jgi:hypothetical protein
MVSEILEEAGIDREKVRRVRRQVLEGVILMCQWQLERMHQNDAATEAPAADTPRKGRKVRVD